MTRGKMPSSEGGMSPESHGLQESDGFAKALIKSIESGSGLDPAIKDQLWTVLYKLSERSKQKPEVVAAKVAEYEAPDYVMGKEKTIENIRPKNEKEVIILRAAKAAKIINKPENQLTKEEHKEVEWFYHELKRSPEFFNGVVDFLKKYANTLVIDEFESIFKVFDQYNGDKEVDETDSTVFFIPKGFSKGVWLEIRRTLISRYLGEIPENENYLLQTPRLNYNHLIRPDLYRYLRNEYVNNEVAGKEEKRQAAYVRDILQDTLSNLDKEQEIADELNKLLTELRKKYPKPKYWISYGSRDKDGFGNFVIEERIDVKNPWETRVVEVVKIERKLLPKISQF